MLRRALVDDDDALQDELLFGTDCNAILPHPSPASAYAPTSLDVEV